jgi:hypothetical protein
MTDQFDYKGVIYHVLAVENKHGRWSWEYMIDADNRQSMPDAPVLTQNIALAQARNEAERCIDRMLAEKP